MKTTPLTHTPTRNCLRSILLLTSLSLPLHSAELQFTLSPTADNRQLGTSYASVGDIDGDEVADIAVADPSWKSGINLGSGIVYLLSGADGTMIRAYQGDSMGSQYFGLSLATFDANADGVLDLAVGSPGYTGTPGYGTGAVRVYSGADGALLFFSTGTVASQYGSAIANAGDQNGDGREDIYVGAPMANSNRGAVYVLSGFDGSILRTVNSPVTFGSFGATLAALGDVDADGLKDVAVGSPALRNGTVGNAGKVSILRSSDSTFPVEIQGTAVYNRLGQTLASAADADGDGQPDLLIGSYSGGIALLVSGANLTTIRDLTIPGHPAYQQVNVGGTVDYDEDGVADIMIGSPALNAAVSPAAGGSRIVSGADGSTLFEMLATSPDTGLGVSQSPLPGYGFAIGENGLIDAATGGSGFAYIHYIEPKVEEPQVIDTDGDGILDDVDAVTQSIMDATVSILGVNSSVENRVDSTGTTLADRFAALGTLTDYRRPSLYLAAATRLIADLYSKQLVSKKEATRLLASSAVGIVLGSCRR
ncbi:FG-GAP repeat protein [Luteolibacter luteus]|uniref:FG-GAP repeat protein n=1 Tax=Luteolibacter luteus TaxID=2728835 RepID=A0A858RN94_9BACT|nr:FG-GAP repeat protein [Luteolibacter luteus]QJE97433.1 hypothetical protein HHL09_17125 [Luteolibacter luteus]